MTQTRPSHAKHALIIENEKSICSPFEVLLFFKWQSLLEWKCDENDPPILQAHNNTNIILRLPMGKRIKDIRWLSVWCRRFTRTAKIFTTLCGHV
ncbi:unnamed protein product [Ceratitis capitata]|uniref:(Mediterranean fruit fly) hypothetical protein n=1 Tax=Ceratitis capitata TaxID=7213 RepID=A0A811U261_CERCA|nr:unnamed protein product [Ceratitis capitata]